MLPYQAKLNLAVTKLLAEGQPVSAQRIAAFIGDPMEFVTTSLSQMYEGGCEFNERGELMGNALTLTPTRHQLEVDGVTLYAWCAIDTLFLPAYIGKPAKVTSTCPTTNTVISLTVTPEGIETYEPPQAVLSIMTAQGCTSGIEGTFCGQVYFFANAEAAKTWIGERPDFVILTVPEAYQLAQTIYIEPIMRHA
jgi:alkylmercury lyase